MIRYSTVKDALDTRGATDESAAVDCGDHMIHRWHVGDTIVLVVEYWSGSHAECQVFTDALTNTPLRNGEAYLRQRGAKQRLYVEAGMFRQFSSDTANEHFIISEPQTPDGDVTVYQQRFVLTDVADLPMLDVLFKTTHQ
jgi:hypothetical protein